MLVNVASGPVVSEQTVSVAGLALTQTCSAWPVSCPFDEPGTICAIEFFQRRIVSSYRAAWRDGEIRHEQCRHWVFAVSRVSLFLCAAMVRVLPMIVTSADLE